MAANIWADRVQETTTTSGTGTITLGGAAPGFQTFVAGIGNGNQCYYCIADPGNNAWEVGFGTVGSGTLARTTVIASSNSNSAVNFSGNVKQVFTVVPATYFSVLTPALTYLLAFENVCGGRLTLNNSFPVPTSDVTAATVLYWSPYLGDLVAQYTGSAFSLSQYGQANLNLTDNFQTGTFTTGSKTVTGLSSTIQLVRGMQVTGTGIAANSVIATIPTGTSITLNNFPSGNQTAQALTFKVPPNTAYDVYFNYNTSIIQLGNAWTTSAGASAARSDTQGLIDGIICNTVAINSADYNTIPVSRYMGSICTTGTAGQTEDSVLNRLVWNMYNRVPRVLAVSDPTSSWTYGTFAYRPANNNTANRVNIMVGQPETTLDLTAFALFNGTSLQVDLETGIAEDATNTNNCNQIALSQIPAGAAAFVHMAYGHLIKFPAIGFHYYQWVEENTSGNTCTIYGTNGVVRKTGLVGSIIM